MKKQKYHTRNSFKRQDSTLQMLNHYVNVFLRLRWHNTGTQFRALINNSMSVFAHEIISSKFHIH